MGHVTTLPEFAVAVVGVEVCGPLNLQRMLAGAIADGKFVIATVTLTEANESTRAYAGEFVMAPVDGHVLVCHSKEVEREHPADAVQAAVATHHPHSG